MRSFVALVLRLQYLVIALAIGVVLAGGWAATQLRQQLFPDISFPFVVAQVDAPGIPPSVLDEQVAQPLGKVVEASGDARTTTVIATDGAVTVYAELELGKDVERATDRILEAMRAVDLPAGVGEPTPLGSFTEQPVLISSIVSDRDDIGELTDRVERLRADLLEVDGVAKVEVPGAQREQVQVLLRPSALAAGLTTNYVLEQLGPDAAERSVEQLQERMIEGAGGRTLGQLATVRTVTDPSAGFAIANGNPSIAVRVQREQDANEVDVVDGAQEVLRAFDREHDDLEVVTLTENATGVKASIRGLLIEGVLGALGAVFVIFLFLRSGRGTLVAAVSIPTSLVFGLLVGYWLDLTLDIITLAGLTIAVGRVIDDAIVVIENISKHIERGSDARTAVVEGTAEVATAIAASTMATVAVFLPLGFLSGFVTSLFRSFSIIVAVSLAASLIVAVTIVPVIAHLMFQRAAREHSIDVHARGKLERWVRPATLFGLRHRTLIVGVALLSAVATGGLVASGAIPTQFLPDSSVQQVYGSVQLRPGTSEADARTQLQELESMLAGANGVEDWQLSYGAETVTFEFGGSPNTVTFVANLEEQADGATVVDGLRSEGQRRYPDAFSVAQLENGPPAGTFQANVRADDPDSLRTATDRLVAFLKKRDDLTEVGGSQGAATIPQLVVTPRPDAQVELASLRRAVTAYTNPAIDQSGTGPSVAVLSPFSLAGGPAAEGEGGGGSAGVARGLASLLQLPVAAMGADADEAGQRTIGEVATLSFEPQLAFVSRSEGRLITTVDATIKGKDTAKITADIKDDIDELERSGELGDVDITYEGDAEFVAQMFEDLGKAMLLAVVLVVLVLVIAFRSIFQPIAILAPVLFSTFGAYAALALTRNALGLPALIGQLLLIGIVVANAILLVDAVVKMRRRGLTANEALREAAVLRVRPVFMTAFATIAALTPLAIGVSGEGGIISKSLGVVVIGGLTLATFGTLVIVPAAYSLIARGRREERRRAAVSHEPAA